MFGQKALIAQYEARIADLKAEIASLRDMVRPRTNARAIPLLAMEADAVLSGQDEALVISDGDVSEAESILAERDRILSGSY